METILLDESYDASDMVQAIARSGQILEVATPYDRYLRQNIDLAFQYLEFAFVGDTLAEASRVLNANVDWASEPPFVRFRLTDIQPDLLLDRLSMLSSLYRDDGYELSEARELFWDYAEEIENNRKRSELPEFVDLFFANLIGSNYDWSDERKHEAGRNHPEWRFHTWMSNWSSHLGFQLYVSPDFWIMPANGEIHGALRAGSGLSVEELKFVSPERAFSDLEGVFLFSRGEVIRLSLNLHLYLARVVEAVTIDDEEEDFLYRPQFDVLDFDFRIASDFSCLTCRLGAWRYILFRERFKLLPRTAVGKLTLEVQDTVGHLLDVGGESVRRKCDWSRLNDEAFESLCYELVIRDGRFRRDKTLRMGTSRSRDGGRDIITEPVARAGQPSGASSRWLVQCKFHKAKKSVGRNDVLVGELIEEYGPLGIIVATNVLIDAGTIDKFERTSNRNGVPVECWDGPYIEHFLNRNPDLFDRYFGDGDGA